MKCPSGMYKIYKIVDNEGKSYVGSTGEYYLCKRLHTHRRDKKSGKGCSSAQLDLYNCEITLLEKASHEERKEREAYWIQNTDCVNIKKLNFDRKKWLKEYYQKNKVKIKEQSRLRYQKKKAEKLNCVQNLEIKP
jgi:peptidyl-tRNA hydrolase